uniref:Timeless N-terminal domain-containing protein n=1 Tax=Anopheles farauti TaxID=69004 RepID=A0A182QD94_9DIPT
MSVYFADIDAVCSTLGWMDGDVYKMDPEAMQGLKHLIWILKQDRPAHECRRYIGGKRIVQTDLIPMVISNFDKPDVVDVLLRLLVNLSFPTLLLYNGNYPRDAVGQRKVMRLIEICEEYKEAFSVKSFWSVLGDRLEKILHTDWSERSEADSLIIERILILIRNVLQVPANVEREKQFDNDASQHDCLLWALHQAGILDMVLYVLGSPHENRFLIHALEIVSLVYREQAAAHLADATLKRSTAEKKTDELLLIKARQQSGAGSSSASGAGASGRKPLSTRHSRFRGTYTYTNVKSISDSDAVCHQSLEKIMRLDLGTEKSRQKPSFRQAKETVTLERKSIFSVRLFLREYCMEILRVYNNMVRQVRRYLDQNGSSVSEFHDDSYLLWAIRFFLEFNRLSGFKIELVSESLSVDTFHWIVTRLETYIDNITSDKTRKSIWARRLQLAVQTYRELLYNMHALEKTLDEKAKELLSLLQNNIFYVVEYRETTIHLLTNFNQSHHTRSYLRDVVEVAHVFFSMLQRFCKGTVRVQQRVKAKRKKTSKKQPRKEENPEEEQENIEIRWLQEAPTIAALLENSEPLRNDLPTPFDSASSVPIDEQKGNCVTRIHSLLRNKQYEQAIKMLYAGRSVWTTDDCFGRETASPDEDLITLNAIFTANIASVTDQQENEGELPGESEDEDETEESEVKAYSMEKDFKFEDFSKRLVDHRVVDACTLVLSDWEKIKTPCLKAAVTLLYRVCVEHKMPSMLFQLSLLRVFQTVLNAPEDGHSSELRRLAIYTVRQLQQKQLTGVADDGGLLFAELLFSKPTRIATAMEIGYDEVYNELEHKRGDGKGWNEQEEEELRRLFVENQENPQTDQDVIDWLLENLINKNRTRRGVMKKLKELGLVFKGPTKKSNRQSKASEWTDELDAKLGVLYDELRLEKNPLKAIAEGLDKKFTRPAIVRRMIRNGLIADESEIKPAKRVKSSTRRNDERRRTDDDESDEEENSSQDDEDEGDEAYELDEADVQRHLKALGGNAKEAIQWLIECFEDVLQLYEDSEPSEDTEGGSPIIPIAAHQTAALKMPEFKRLLRALGVLDVGKQSVYHRIPFKFGVEALKKRIDILKKSFENPTDSPMDEDEHEPNTVAHDEVTIRSPDRFERERRSMSPLLVSNDEEDDDENNAGVDETGPKETTNSSPASFKRHRSDSSDSAPEMSLNVSKAKKKRKMLVLSSDEED